MQDFTEESARINILSTQEQPEHDLGASFNSGVDVYCFALKLNKKLTKKREYQTALFPCFKYRKIPAKKLSARTKKDLKDLSKLGLVHRFPSTGAPKAFQFANEERWLKQKLKQDCAQKKLSLTQKIFIYSVAQNYRAPKGVDYNDLSLAVIIDLTTVGMGQEKLSSLLNRSRRSLNSKLKINQHIEVINQHVKISSSAFDKFKNKQQFNSYLSRANLKGYKVNFKGEVYRQIANKYELKIKIKYSEQKSFWHSNRVLNSSLESHKSSYADQIPKVKFRSTTDFQGGSWAKEISIRRIARRNQKLLLRTLGVEKETIEDSNKMSKRLYGKDHMNTLPSKIHKEIRVIKGALSLTSEFSANGNVKRLKIHKGNWNFTQENEFQRFLIKIQNHTTANTKDHHKMRKTQRLSMAFFNPAPSSSDYVRKFM